MEHLKMFLRWCVNEHPEIVNEYKAMLKGAMEELEEMIIAREIEEEKESEHLASRPALEDGEEDNGDD
jgi:hypothetical protein